MGILGLTPMCIMNLEISGSSSAQVQTYQAGWELNHIMGLIQVPSAGNELKKHIKMISLMNQCILKKHKHFYFKAPVLHAYLYP